MIGLLFARPTDPFAKTIFILVVDYFNSRSGAHIDFFCLGYTKKTHDKKLSKSPPIVIINNVKWWFDSERFNKIRDEDKMCTHVQYSGGTGFIACERSLIL